MIYGIIAPSKVPDRKAAEEKIRRTIDGLSTNEPEAIVTLSSTGLSSYAAQYANKRWPNAILQVITPAHPRPADSFDFKLKRIARVHEAPRGQEGENVSNAEDMLIGIVDKLIAFTETRYNSDSVLSHQIDRARSKGVTVKIEKLPR